MRCQLDALVTARNSAGVKLAGRPRGAHDLIIAATARDTNREIISADPEAFQELPGVDAHSRR